MNSRLPAIQGPLGRALRTGDKEGCALPICSVLFVEHETGRTRRRPYRTPIAQARLLPAKHSTTFDFTAVPCCPRRMSNAITAGEAGSERVTNILLFGPPGWQSHSQLRHLGLARSCGTATWRGFFTRTTDWSKSFTGPPRSPLERLLGQTRQI